MAQAFNTAGSAEEPPRKKQKQQQDPAPLSTKEAETELDDAVASLFYGTGIPLHQSRREAFIHGKVSLCRNFSVHLSSAIKYQ